jgi:glycosyltransferase involved in cell wall biosynthesis
VNIVFIDPVGWDYDVSTPENRPMGGSQSALCYLANELRQRGHSIVIVNGKSKPSVLNGVQYESLNGLNNEVLSQPNSAIVFLNPQADHAIRIREIISPSSFIVQWQQHAADEVAVQGLFQPKLQQSWDAIVCVSEWQRNIFQKAFAIPAKKMFILRNSPGPNFRNLFSNLGEFQRLKQAGCQLVYTSTPFRGLELLLEWFPELLIDFPNLELHVYSSLAVYNIQDEPSEMQELYQQCQAQPQIKYFGGIAQGELASQLRSASFLAYPNIFPETSCIAAMEAMAAGLDVVTTDLGALPETCQHQARLAKHGEGAIVLAEFKANWMALMKQGLELWHRDFETWSVERFAQTKRYSQESHWAQRALEWENFLQLELNKRVYNQA